MESFYVQVLDRKTCKPIAVKKKGYIKQIGNYIVCFYKAIVDDGYKPITFWYPIDYNTGLSMLYEYGKREDDDKRKLSTIDKAEQFVKDNIDRLESIKKEDRYKTYVDDFQKLKQNPIE